jgi:site-specific DNA-methyltransferase (adenine-specific)
MNDNIKLYNGDCLEILKTFPDKSIDMIFYETTPEETKKSYHNIWLEFQRIIKDKNLINKITTYNKRDQLHQLEQVIKQNSALGDKILDSAMGMGYIGVACINTGRNFIGIESNAEFFRIAQNRIREHSHK